MTLPAWMTRGEGGADALGGLQLQTKQDEQPEATSSYSAEPAKHDPAPSHAPAPSSSSYDQPRGSGGYDSQRQGRGGGGKGSQYQSKGPSSGGHKAGGAQVSTQVVLTEK